MDNPQLSEDLLHESMNELLKVGAFIRTKGDPAVMRTFQKPPSLLALLGLTIVLGLVAWAVSEAANYYEITNNWAKYRCVPSVTPFAKFYGHDLATTMNFCVGEAVKAHAGGVINPIYDGINAVTGVVDTVYTKVEAVEGGVGQLLTGFESFMVNFVNSFRLLGTRVRMSFVRIKDIFERVYGIFIAFAYAAISAITFGENLVCNPLVTFVAGFAGVDICCFAPETRVVMADGSTKAICDVAIGDRLMGDAVVCSTYLFDGTDTLMYRAHGVHVSGNHYICQPHDGAMVHVREYAGATVAEPLQRLWCLGTSTNIIPVQAPSGRTVLFADYEESSDPAVIAAAQRMAEVALNGAANGPIVEDYSLGLDPRALILMEGGDWAPLHTIAVGSRLSNGAVVKGVIREICEAICESPTSGLCVSAAQLIRGPDGRWVRATTVWPLKEIPLILYHLMIDNNASIQMANGHEVLEVRDYAEVTSLDMQAPYDQKLIGSGV